LRKQQFMMIKNNRIAHLLSFFLLFFFNCICSQIYISEGAGVYIEENTVVTKNLEEVASRSDLVTHKDLSIGKAAKDKKILSERKIKLDQQKKLVSADNGKKKRASSEDIAKTLNNRYTDSDNHRFTLSDSTKKPIISPDQHLKWDLSSSDFIFVYNSLDKRERILYTSQYLSSRHNQAFRTRPPPVLFS